MLARPSPAADSPRRSRRPRLTLARRLTAALAAMAVLSSLLAVVVQDRALSRDLRRAAETRLARAATAAERLIDGHLSALVERYRAVAGTPQLRATLELADAPTLTFLAEQLRLQQHAELIAFIGADGALKASSGDPALHVAARPARSARLLLLDGAVHAALTVPLETGGRRVGALLAVERVEPTALQRWSELCGAEIAIGTARVSAPDLLVTQIPGLKAIDAVVVSSLEPERAALAAARRKLAVAGLVALVVALLACVALARSIVRPIQAIRVAVDRVRDGDLAVRLHSVREDEIGDVAHGIDQMLDEIRASHGALDARVAELNRSQDHLAKAQQLARVGSFDYDPRLAEIHGSAEYWALLGFGDARKGATLEEVVERLHPEDRAALVGAVRGVLEQGVSGHFDHRVVLADGSVRFFHTQVQAVGAGAERHLEGTLQDITDRRRAEEQIRYLAYHDGLTGLGNRQLFSERVEIAIAQTRRNRGRFGVLFLDLDHFKRINDTLGHSAGDALLREVADRIMRSVRDTDSIARSNERRFETAVSRLGGDEFTILITDIVDPAALASVADRILIALRRPFQLSSQDLVISASIGIASYPSDGESVDTLLSNADSAMYHAKSSGRNAYQFYDQSMNASALRRLRLESRLRHALEHDELALHYQPKIDLASGRIAGFEALARWRDPELGVVSPGDFIPVAEQTGLIAPLGRWVARCTCEQVVAWERSLGPLELRVSFNVSAREFGPGMARDLLAIVAETGVNPVRLQIEITESAILRDAEAVIATLQELRARGISVALDDFGTGYSSLSYLRRLPVDTLKIDRSFIEPITRSSEAAALTRSIIALGKALGLCVVAEGVETRAQRTLLTSFGCDEIQGFLIAPALPADEAFARLRAEEAATIV